MMLDIHNVCLFVYRGVFLLTSMVLYNIMYHAYSCKPHSNQNKQKGGDIEMPEQLLTVRQVAKILAVTEKKVRELCMRGSKQGGLEALKIDSLWKIPEEEVGKFIEFKKRR